MGALDAISTDAREILLEALMGVAWADRDLSDEERQYAQAAAVSLGLVLDSDRSLLSPDRKPVPVEDLAVDKLGQQDRELIYLCAAWMALADEIVLSAEAELLERMAEHFSLSPVRSGRLREISIELREHQPPTEAWWRDFDELVVEAARMLAHHLI